MLVLVRELAAGKHLYIGERSDTAERPILPGFDALG
jgi:hypothetical protein